eukprot:scaffold50070_cov112-Isochrysis_galbana.AAC.7
MLATTVASLALVPGLRCADRHKVAVSRHASPSCCICINCKFVDRCETYHWVETQHKQLHVTETPDFQPAQPQIQVFIRQDPIGVLDPEVAAKATTRTPVGSLPESTEDFYDGPTETTTEFDVFACDAFEADPGKWIRLMPDADFIPT